MIELVPLAIIGPASLFDGGLVSVFYYVVKFLAVAGGALFGFLVTPSVVRLLVRLFARRQTPESVALLSRFAGAFLVGFLIYLIPIGPGGQGGGGSGGGKGAGQGPGKDGSAARDKDKPGPKNHVTNKEPPKAEPPPHVLAIHVLGGDAVKQERYYQLKVGGKTVDLTDAGVKKIIVEDRKGAKVFKRVEILLDENSVDETNAVVTDLVDLVKRYDLTVKLVKNQ